MLAGQFLPTQNILNILGCDFKLVAVPDCTFEKNTNAEGEFLESWVVESLDVIVSESFAGCLDLAGDSLEGIGLGVGEGVPRNE